MSLDWSRLSPHRPLKLNDPLHVRRPEGGGDELASWIEAGVDAVAVAGPVGSGKSTELACAASRLQSRFVVVQIPLDRLLDMRRITEDDVFIQLAERVTKVARDNLRLQFSGALQQRLEQVDAAPPGPSERTSSSRDLLLSVLREVGDKSHQGKLVLLIDGLEKCEADSALRVVRALLEVREETRVIFVAPYSLVVGHGAHELVTSIDRFFFVRAVPVRQDQGARGEAGRAFLREIIRVRLGLPGLHMDLANIVDRAAEASGGVPRSFLQLVGAAATYAKLGERDTIEQEDLQGAMRDHAESRARLLVEGDIEQLRAADGTTGIEIPEERRLRLLMHGLLLEYKTDHGDVVHAAPLLQDVLRLGGPA